MRNSNCSWGKLSCQKRVRFELRIIGIIVKQTLDIFIVRTREPLLVVGSLFAISVSVTDPHFSFILSFFIIIIFFSD